MDQIGAPYSAKAFANLILDWAHQLGVPVTPLKLQKLLYFTHAEYLCRFGEPLVDENFEAWTYGPVIPTVYEQFKEFNRKPITKRASTFNPIARSSTIDTATVSDEMLERIFPVFSIYVDVDAGLLSEISHKKGGPWEIALKEFEAHRNINRLISNDLIRTAHRLASA